MAKRLMNIVFLIVSFTLTRASTTKREVPTDAIVQTAAAPTSYHESQPGIQLQSGSISYLVPDSKLSYLNTIQDFAIKEGFLEKIKTNLPAVIKTIAKSLGKIAVNALTVAAVGVTFTVIVLISDFLLCKFTSFCFLPSISLTGFDNDDLQEAVRAYIAPDNLTALSQFVISSIEKYSKKYNKKTRTS